MTSRDGSSASRRTSRRGRYHRTGKVVSNTGNWPRRLGKHVAVDLDAHMSVRHQCIDAMARIAGVSMSDNGSLSTTANARRS